MTQGDSQLTAEDRAALSEVAKGIAQRIIPADLKARLVKLGLVESALGGAMLTTRGRLILEAGASDASEETYQAIVAAIMMRRKRR